MANDKVKIIVLFLVMSVIIVGGVYWVGWSADNENATRLGHINRGYRLAKGIITEKTSYKGHSVTVRYKIEGKEYEVSTGWDYNHYGLGVGDSIKFRYALDSPDIIITEMSEGY